MTTRRNAITHALALLGGAAGLGAAGRLAAADGDAPRSFVLHARGLSALGSAARLPEGGERLTLRAELAERPDGPAVGRLLGAAFAIDAAERLELHTFELPAGTIVGTGRAGIADGTFAVLGGTGAFAGARGTYAVRLSRRELGGDGTAEISVDLVA